MPCYWEVHPFLWDIFSLESSCILSPSALNTEVRECWRMQDAHVALAPLTSQFALTSDFNNLFSWFLNLHAIFLIARCFPCFILFCCVYLFSIACTNLIHKIYVIKAFFFLGVKWTNANWIKSKCIIFFFGLEQKNQSREPNHKCDHTLKAIYTDIKSAY